MNLEDFIKCEFGSIENYSECYISVVKSMFYSLGSGIYDVQDSKKAISILKNNFIFNLMSGANSIELNNLLSKLISSRLYISHGQSAKLKSVVCSMKDNYIDALNDFLAGKNCLLPQKNNLHSVFSNEELYIIKSIFLEENAKLRSAYSFLSSKVPNIDNLSHYNSDEDVFYAIKELVLSGDDD